MAKPGERHLIRNLELRILYVLHKRGPLNSLQLSQALGQLHTTIAYDASVLAECGLAKRYKRIGIGTREFTYELTDLGEELIIPAVKLATVKCKTFFLDIEVGDADSLRTPTSATQSGRFSTRNLENRMDLRKEAIRWAAHKDAVTVQYAEERLARMGLAGRTIVDAFAAGFALSKQICHQCHEHVNEHAKLCPTRFKAEDLRP